MPHRDRRDLLLWIVGHLPDIILIGVAVPVALLVLLIH
jgi:hypothetical protein